MLPNIFPLIRDATAVTDIIGTSPVRFYHGKAPQNVVAPYITHRAITITPQNCLDGTPPVDRVRVHLTCWSDNAGTGSLGVKTLALAVRDAIETTYEIIEMGDMVPDVATQRYRIDIDVSVWNHREAASSS